MFASRVTKEVEVEDDGKPVVVTIQKLSARSLEKAREAKSAAQLAAMRAGGKEMWSGLRSAEVDAVAEKIAEKRAKQATDLKAQRQARYDAHDRDHILRAGIVRWTAERRLKDPDDEQDAIGDLDEQTAQKLHEAILDLSLPPLDPVEAEATLAKD